MKGQFVVKAWIPRAYFIWVLPSSIRWQIFSLYFSKFTRETHGQQSDPGIALRNTCYVFKMEEFRSDLACRWQRIFGTPGATPDLLFGPSTSIICHWFNKNCHHGLIIPFLPRLKSHRHFFLVVAQMCINMVILCRNNGLFYPITADVIQCLMLHKRPIHIKLMNNTLLLACLSATQLV